MLCISVLTSVCNRVASAPTRIRIHHTHGWTASNQPLSLNQPFPFTPTLNTADNRPKHSCASSVRIIPFQCEPVGILWMCDRGTLCDGRLCLCCRRRRRAHHCCRRLRQRHRRRRRRRQRSIRTCSSSHQQHTLTYHACIYQQHRQYQQLNTEFMPWQREREIRQCYVCKRSNRTHVWVIVLFSKLSDSSKMSYSSKLSPTHWRDRETGGYRVTNQTNQQQPGLGTIVFGTELLFYTELLLENEPPSKTWPAFPETEITHRSTLIGFNVSFLNRATVLHCSTVQNWVCWTELLIVSVLLFKNKLSFTTEPRTYQTTLLRRWLVPPDLVKTNSVNTLEWRRQKTSESRRERALTRAFSACDVYVLQMRHLQVACRHFRGKNARHAA